ncbi:MAG: hypothetical protein LBU57_05145 [Dysgonamonadaceae bacterium]|jgi:hypothetical protein|nr:hypothetical protein [Dysgonamonadaceae bacterium]
MNKGIRTYIVLLIILFALILCAYGFFALYGQNYAPEYFILIPVFYMLDGLFLSVTIGKQAERGERIPVKRLMFLRLIRIVGLLVVLVLGIVLDKVHMLAFVAFFVVFYVVYLVFETIVMKNSQRPDNNEK